MVELPKFCSVLHELREGLIYLDLVSPRWGVMWKWPDHCPHRVAMRMRSEGGHCEQGTWKPLVDPTALLPSVWPLSTEIFFNKLRPEVWKSEIVNTQVYMLIPWVSDRRWDHRKGSLWSGPEGILWDELESPHWSLFCRSLTFSRHALVFYKLPQAAQKTYSDEKGLGIKDVAFCCRNV